MRDIHYLSIPHMTPGAYDLTLRPAGKTSEEYRLARLVLAASDH